MIILANLLRWTFALLIAILAAFTALLAADPARAQALHCGPVDQVVEHLAKTYQEQLLGDGGGPNGTRMMVFIHPSGSTWTVIGLLADGTACFIASGTNWTVRELTPAGSET